MNRQDYLSQLENGLKRLPKVETANIISRYAECFDEAGEENTPELLAELGDPKELSSRILSDMAIKYLKKIIQAI